MSMSSEDLEEKLDKACDIIERMATGLEWWNDMFPQQSSGADDEMLEEANNFIRDMNK